MKDRFIKEKDCIDGSTLLAGEEETQISAYGKIEIKIISPTGCCTILLNNVLYVPKFMTNIVSARLLEAKGVFVDTERQRLHSEGKIFLLLTRIGDHYVLEDNTKGSTPVS